MKKILYLSFYFEPDLCAGSFRNSPLVKEIAKQLKNKLVDIDVYTTLPNRYSTYSKEAPSYEEREGYKVHRIQIPLHKSGFVDQIVTFYKYYTEVNKLVRNTKYDLVVASSSRLFTAYLGYRISKKIKAPLYLDIRDIFVDTINDVVSSKLIKSLAIPILKYVEKIVFNHASHINLISGGFKEYFKKFTNCNYSYFTNGIDDEFIQSALSNDKIKFHNEVKKILYAGNIGEGQGLHKIVPQASALLGPNFEFVIIGDGGAKSKLVEELNRLNVTNVQLRNPVNRNELIEEYKSADYLFLHLNDYDAFKKVLPSKIFELSVFDKPMIAGVAGFAKEFIETNIPNSIVFEPGNVEDFKVKFENFVFDPNLSRSVFIANFKRANINQEMATSIIQYL